MIHINKSVKYSRNLLCNKHVLSSVKMNGKTKNGSETDFSQLYNEYMTDKKRTQDLYFGQSCFNHECKGKYILPQEENHVLTCSICGGGIVKAPFEDWLHSSRITTFHNEERANNDNEYIDLEIVELQDKIKELRQTKKENKAKIKNAKARRKTIRNALGAL